MNAVRNRGPAALALVLSALGALGAAAPARAADNDTYAAIVFAPNGKYGYASAGSSKDQAIDDAKGQCQATGNLTAVWAKNGFVALVIGQNDVVEAAAGATKADAVKKAKQACKDAGGVNPTLVICISSDGD